MLTTDGLDALALRVWAGVPAGGVIWLAGEIGAGKTTLAQAVVRAAGGATARSPTYALVHEYASPDGPIIHVDCYRLRHPDEAEDLDLETVRHRARLMLVEWPERGGRFVPPPHVHLRLHHTAVPAQRRVEWLR